MKVSLSAAFAATAVASRFGATLAQDETTIAQTLLTRDDTQGLYQLLGLADLLETLNDPNSDLTLFAPTNQAFSRLPYGVLEFLALPENNATLDEILRYHVALGALDANEVVADITIETLVGESISSTLSAEVGEILLNDDVVVKETDIMATNGFIHTIGDVLIPPSLRDTVMGLVPTVGEIAGEEQELAAFNLTAFEAGLGSVLNDGDENVTIFAPNNEAFVAFLDELSAQGFEAPTDEIANILSYHIVSPGTFLEEDIMDGTVLANALGENLAFFIADDGIVSIVGSQNNATITQTNLIGSNGVIHIIDSVLLPSGFGEPSIADIITGDEDLTTLTDLLNSTGLLSQLTEGDGPFTVFAPTDDAFGPLLPTIADLSNPRLFGLLAFHTITNATITSDMISDGDVIETALGGNLSLAFEVDDDGNIFIITNGLPAMIIGPDMLAGNGVVHKINNVLIPPTDASASTPSPAMEPSPPPTTAPTMAPTMAPASAGTTATVVVSVAATMLALFVL